MKYKQLLDTNMVPEWRNKYLDYHDLDNILNKAIENKNMKATEKGVDMYFELIKFNQKFANFFSRECQTQLEKVNSFHKDMLCELQGKFNNLHDQLDQVLSSAIYREIQPNLSNYNNSPCPDTESNTTISSISELFKNHFRNNLTGRRLTGCQEFSGGGGGGGTCGSGDQQSTIATNGGTQQNQDAVPSTLACLYPRSQNPVNSSNNVPVNLAPINQCTEACNYNYSSTSGNNNTSVFTRNGVSNSNLRFGREKITVMARKLSEGFSNSAQRISSNLTSFQNSFTYQNPNHSNHDSFNFVNNQASVTVVANGTLASSARQRRPRLKELIINNSINDSTSYEYDNEDENKFDFINFQTLASSSSQSRGKIVACYKRKLSNLKFAFRELYFNLVLFEQYTQLNHNGFQQILRKHDRMFASSLGRKFYEEHIQTADFYNDLQSIDHLIESVEHIYTLHFENGNRRRAIEKLQVPSCVYKPFSGKLNFRVGYEFGIFSVLLMLVLLVGFLSETGYDWRTVFRLYRSPLMLTIFLFQTGISIVIWKHYKINHVLIFELNPRNNLSFHHFIEFGSLLGIIWSISVLLFLLSARLNVKPSICPLIVVLLIILYLLNPTRTCYHQARFWLLKRLGTIFIAPFSGPVRFADFWIADQLVSIVPLFLDLEYLFCFYTTGDVLSNDHLTPYYANRCVTRNPQDLVIRTIVAALPAWFRCAQCLRRWHDENWLRLHLENAGKYWCMVMVVVLSSISQYNKSSFELDTKRVIWMVAAIFTSALTAYWDIIYDFGLFNKYDKNDVTTKDDDSRKDCRKASVSTVSGYELDDQFYNRSKKNKRKHYPFLRKELVYPPWVYYFAIVEDIILRFGWIITISLTEFSGAEAGLVVSLLAPMEMFRRFVWNCIRLENEQLNNCGLFRAVRDIPMEVVAPIDESHLDKVIMLMDCKDGISMRSRLMKRRTLRPDRVSFMILQQPDTVETMTRRSDMRP